MTIHVRSYTKHLNGKLVTVMGYDATARDAADPTTASGPSVRSQVESIQRTAMGVAPPGVHPLPRNDLSLTAGVTAYYVRPAGKLPPQPIIRWRRTILPIDGAYKIPSRNIRV